MNNIIRQGVLICCVFISCGIKINGDNSMEKRNEYRTINIRSHSYGEDIFPNLELNDITITLSNHYNIHETFVEIKSKGLTEGMRTSIEIQTFDKIFKSIENIDFKKVYSENYSGCDGWGMFFEIARRDGLVSYDQRIELFSPIKNSNTPETNKLLDIYEGIKSVSGYEDYYKLIKSKMR
jgi:hypothetical protein